MKEDVVEATEQDVKAVAHGGQPVWEETFEHPEHGPLKFTAKLPTALLLTKQSIEMDNILADLTGEPSFQTQVMAAAISGLKVLIRVPVIHETRKHDDDTGKTTIEKVYYDPEAELHEAFLGDVWRAYSVWRSSFVNKVDELKNSSGETSGSGSNESSTATTVSPSTTPA
jgi:hypothetical protein